ncbi:internal scaffolding protein [Tortoise microvirus 68]|nr:internal scaffolding protein [Tortoise microvirus 68]
MEAISFETQYRKPKRFFTSEGSPIKITYGAVFDNKGRLQLEEKGSENLYDYIQSFAESVDIHVILKKFANGDSTVLSRAQGFYGDVTEFPTTYADVLNRVIEGENFFNTLPVETRSKFNHSYSEFIASIGSQQFFDAFGMSKPSDQNVVDPVDLPDVVKEVKSDV